ncbi:hypothetical protein PH7735_01417 [Shimia thalassica]|uniref:Uncharacterized protein n=1 Tax=Shimia thalassica TaxID=1715693 RepID=A0A0P1I5W3_9RHOB|nr:hypothetical protein [Shimia thalassica]CUJ91856.1 hypothetical protein PH7735_01417 [Shimia thalassica]
MSKRFLLATFFIGSFVAGAATAQFGYVPWRVNALPGNGNFEVVEGPGAGNQRYWCEAAKFARDRLRVRGNTRMYIINPEGRSQTQANSYGVGFTVDPSPEVLEAANSAGGYSVSITKIGYNLSVSHSQSFCGANVLF